MRQGLAVYDKAKHYFTRDLCYTQIHMAQKSLTAHLIVSLYSVFIAKLAHRSRYTCELRSLYSAIVNGNNIMRFGSVKSRPHSVLGICDRVLRLISVTTRLFRAHDGQNAHVGKPCLIKNRADVIIFYFFFMLVRNVSVNATAAGKRRGAKFLGSSQGRRFKHLNESCNRKALIVLYHLRAYSVVRNRALYKDHLAVVSCNSATEVIDVRYAKL